MPYLGNNPVAGDHVNNFKVLDDISSYTETFDGSASTIVSTSNNTIRAVDHRFIQGQRVTYTNGGGGNIGGLTTGTAYFVIFDTASTFKLATNASNAANSVAINLSSVGSGSSHTLNAAFDGVNTKFKITYNNGTAARFNNATQLNIAINNVVQRPNQSALTFTEGFAIEDNHKIVFKVAPTNQDIFWGSIIANTLTTFDISDHKIDTFTGDGSTTEFTLSHTPANNESLMVTINGVLQHPSNTSTARAYTLLASIIQFTAAPGVGDEIQVRHLGFAGATTADVSGFYGRTGNVVLTASDHITTGDVTSRNIKSSGITTATTFISTTGTFNNNVGISSNSPVEKLDINGSINAGGENSPVFQIRNEQGSTIRGFKHYFDVFKNNLAGNGANHTIVSITQNQAFHQAVFEVTYGTRLQSISDVHTRPNKIIFGVNRYNSGNSVNVTKTVVEQHSEAASHCDVNIVTVSPTNYIIRVEFSSTANVSSGAGGWVEGSVVLGGEFTDVDYYHGVRR